MPHPGAILPRVQPKTRRKALLNGVVATGPAEEEVDGRQQPIAFQTLDDIPPIRRVSRTGATVPAPRLRIGGARTMVLVTGKADKVGVDE